jgi:hypothetical protein
MFKNCLQDVYKSKFYLKIRSIKLLEADLAPRHTVRPERRHSLPSMAPRHTVRPERKKPLERVSGFASKLT